MLAAATSNAAPAFNAADARAAIDRLVRASGADVAVAFRTLDGRDELLIQPDVVFHAASTMKVPVMIELFRQARAGLLRLDDRVRVANAFHSIVDGSPYTLDVSDDSDAAVYQHIGGEMSYRELCEAMITVSSNFAANLIIEHLGAANIQRTTDGLGANGMRVLRGVEDTKAFEKGLNNTTTARALMTLMSAIADGKAVDRQASGEMRAILQRQKFNDRIPAGLPPGTVVAHKTGEITRIQHDAAIVDAPRPFVLVILVRGIEDSKRGAALAADITRVLYRASQEPPDPTVDLLRELIRLDTSNPPGHEGQIAELLAAKLKPLGFEIDIVPTPEAGKAHFIARLRGDGSQQPVLLASHADVVGVERDKWTLDPFAGIVKDGYVYGRGAIDFKGGIAVFARAVMMLAERHVPLARDVIFLAEADEEAAQYNTSWLARDHWPKIACEFALNEGGWIIRNDAGKVQYVSISTADKSSVAVKVTAHGTSTHSSMPRPDNAIFALSRAMATLAGYESPVTLTPSTRQFFLTLAKTSAPPEAEWYRTIATSTDAAAVSAADAAISRDPMLHAFLHNTLAPVLLNAGFRSNVIPGSAEATINVRVIPGSDPNVIVSDLARVIGNPAIDVKLATPSAGPSTIPESPQDTALFTALAHQAHAAFPGAEVTPYLFQAGTDAGAWRTRGVPVYGIYPYPISNEDLSRMHGNDERVSVASLRQGTEMIFQTLVEVAGKR